MTKRRDEEELSRVKVTVKRVTEKAIMVVHEDGDSGTNSDGIWVPKSQISDDGDITASAEVGEEGEMLIPEWLAEAKGLV